MSFLIEDMSITPSPNTIEHHLEQWDHRRAHLSSIAPSPASPSSPNANLDAASTPARDGDDADAASASAPDADSDAASVMSEETIVGDSDGKKDADAKDEESKPEPIPTTIALAPHNLTTHDLRSSRMAATMHSVFGIDQPITLSPLADDFDASADDAKSIRLSRRDVRRSRFGKKLDGLFGLDRHAHFTDAPAEVVTYDDAESVTEYAASVNDKDLDDKDGANDPRSAFSLSPTTPRPRRASAVVDPNLVQWSTADKENPHAWSTMYKWTLTAVIGFMTLNATFSSSAPSAAVSLIAAEFGVSEEVATLTTSIYLIGYILGPAFWGPGSELLGRRLVLILTMGSFCLLTIGQALAPNISVFLSTRFLSGFFAVAPLVNGGGVVADIWDPLTRGLATNIFSTMIFLGPVLGPVVGGFIIPSSLGWRFVFWVIVLFSACSTLLAIFVLPETHAPTLMAQKARRLRMLLPQQHAQMYAPAERIVWTMSLLFERTLARPFKMLVVEPILLLITIYIGVVYGCLYSLFEALPIVFGQIRGFTIEQTGLVFLFVGLGAVFSTALDIYLARGYPALLVQWRGSPPPEKRLYGAMIAGPAFVISIFWLGWTGYTSSIHWIVPALSTVLIGFSVSLVFNSFMTYLVDTYLANTASAFAALTIIRSSVGAAFPLFIRQLFGALGVNGACSLIGGIGILLAPLPFIFFRYGARIRGRSEFAPCLDLKIKQEMEDEQRRAVLDGAGHV